MDLRISGSMDEIDLSAFRAPHFDIVVIGSGPAGQKAAISAAKEGAHVAIVERDALAGGVCLNTGTVPSKTLREAILYLTGWRQRGFYGKNYRVKEGITSQDLIERTNLVIQQEREIINEALALNGVSRLVGSAKFVAPDELRVSLAGDETTVRGTKMIICVGTTPRRPADVPFDDVNIFDSDAVFGRENELRPLPDSMIVLGAGVIGIEYACMFAALGIPTTLVDPRPNPLEFVDEEISALLYRAVREAGMTLHFGTTYANIELSGEPERASDRVIVQLKSGETIAADGLLFALGRIPATEKLGIAEIGVKMNNRGLIMVDEWYRTNIPTIYAAGDVIGFPSLASTSADQGRIAAMHALGKPAEQHLESIPYGIYTIPEISMAGKTEQQLRTEGVPYFVGTGLWRDTARGKMIGDSGGALKLIFHKEDRRLLGVHVLGEGATELLHIGQAVMHFGGGVDYFLNNVFNYPTLAEAYKIAARNAMNRMAGKALHTAPLLEQVYEDQPVSLAPSL